MAEPGEAEGIETCYCLGDPMGRTLRTPRAERLEVNEVNRRSPSGYRSQGPKVPAVNGVWASGFERPKVELNN